MISFSGEFDFALYFQMLKITATLPITWAGFAMLVIAYIIEKKGVI